MDVKFVKIIFAVSKIRSKNRTFAMRIRIANNILLLSSLICKASKTGDNVDYNGGNSNVIAPFVSTGQWLLFGDSEQG